MSLVSKIHRDIDHLFIKQGHGHFESEHTWNGVPFLCVADEEAALKRKNNNVVDIAWDNNTTEVIVYVARDKFPGHAEPNEHGFFDNKPMNILQVNDDMGMLTIALVANYTRDVNT